MLQWTLFCNQLTLRMFLSDRVHCSLPRIKAWLLIMQIFTGTIKMHHALVTNRQVPVCYKRMSLQGKEWSTSVPTMPFSQARVASGDKYSMLWIAETWKISRKPFLQCFTCGCTFSSSRVIAEKTTSKMIYRLLQSLQSLKLFKL